MVPLPEYSQSLFVDRPTIRSAIERWAKGEWGKRLLSVIGPPGTGKTWLLRDLYRQWTDDSSQTQDDPPAFWLDVPQIVKADEGRRDRLLNDEEVFHWLEEVRRRALKYCPEIREIDRTMEASRAVQDLVDDLCLRCVLKDPPIFILDRFDEVTETAAEVVCDRLIQYLMLRQCTRVLMAYREEWAVSHGILRFNQESQPMEVLISSDEQFRRLAMHQGAESIPSSLAVWQNSLKNYPWMHPFINAFLFHCSWQGREKPLGSVHARDVRQCCDALITRRERPNGRGYEPLKPEEFELLLQIANKCSAQWTVLELENRVGRKLFDPAVTVLFDYGLIFSIPRTPRYKIMDGLRELLCDLYEMEVSL